MSRYKYEMLLTAQLLLAIISPLFSATEFARSIVDLGITLVFLTAIYLISNATKHFIIGIVLMLPTLLVIWGVKFIDLPQLEYAALIGSVLFFCYICGLILVDIFRAKMVTLDIIAAGVCVYLFFGNICGFIYTIIGMADPNAFNVPAATASYIGDRITDISSAMYFSFVTLTTLGYGDITPIDPFARSLAVLEAAAGQFYLTIFIASLVGVHISSSTNGGKA